MVNVVSNGGEPKSDRLIYFKDLKPRKGIKLSEMSLWRMMKAGEFPQPVIVGKQRKAWFESEIDEWIANLPRGKGRRPPGKTD